MTKEKIIKISLVILAVVVVLLLIWFIFLYPRQVFNAREKEFAEAGKRYYEINKARLPKDKSRVVSVSLSTLVKQKYLDDLYGAYNTLCDLSNSNVKVISDGQDYTYHTYLKCGNLESDTDHTPPVITLNGAKQITLSKGEEYKEPGVAKVVDDNDGTIDISKVEIEGTVDTNKVGTYEIEYTVNDTLNNKTTVTRKVVVEERLATIVTNDTQNTNRYYKGMADNNYVMFNNMLFRIIKINDNNTITIVSDEPLANVDYTNNGRFTDSSLDKWLNDYFYNLLEKKYQKLITSSKWCDDTITDYMTTECTRESDKRNIGILSLQDYNNTLMDNSSFLDLRAIVWYSNFDKNNNPWTLTNLYAYPLKAEAMNQEYLFNVRPALTLKSNTKVLSGNGSINDPYILIENEVARRNTLVNKRQIGEYIRYSGYTYRISNINKNGTTEIIMTDVIKNNDIEINIGYNNGNSKKIYNSKQDGNIGYQIVNELTKYISTKLFTKTKVKVPIYEDRVTYKGKKEIKEYNDIITIPSVFEVFTAKGELSSNGGYWYIDSSKADNRKTVMNAIGTVNYTPVTDEREAGVKVKATLKKDVMITGGSGTLENPYTISD